VSDSNLAEFVAFAEGLADASREILLAVASQVPEVGIKSDVSLVTATDRAVEARLREMIEARFPEHGVLGEELGQRDVDAEFVWVLDPIDGTAPFVAGLPVYGTLIGLAHGGRPVLGVIDHPATDDRWLGVVGEGTRRNGAPQRTRACANLETAFATNSSPDFLAPEERERFERLRASVRYMQYGGSCYACSPRGARTSRWMPASTSSTCSPSPPSSRRPGASSPIGTALRSIFPGRAAWWRRGTPGATATPWRFSPRVPEPRCEKDLGKAKGPER
jgi:histidinol phosphatase-like enzyme (inositol monophosphatase family)